MKKIAVYLDTSFINYLVASRLPEKMRDTLALWNLFIANEHFEVVLSETVDEELQRCYDRFALHAFGRI